MKKVLQPATAHLALRVFLHYLLLASMYHNYEKKTNWPNQGFGATFTATNRRGRSYDGRAKARAQPRRPHKGVGATATAAETEGCNHDACKKRERNRDCRKGAVDAITTPKQGLPAAT
jgi:hypothetical protein